MRIRSGTKLRRQFNWLVNLHKSLPGRNELFISNVYFIGQAIGLQAMAHAQTCTSHGVDSGESE